MSIPIPGERIIFVQPMEPGVWYSPQTLIWLAILTVIPFLLALALRAGWRRVAPVFASPSDWRRSAEDYLTVQARAARASPALHRGILALVYALVLFLTACVGVLAYGVNDESSGITTFVVDTRAGAPAAFALLFLASTAAFTTTMVGLYWAASRLATPSLLRVIWLVSGGIGCGAAGWVTLGMKAPGYVIWFGCASALLLTGVLYRLIGWRGKGVITRARAEEAARQRDYAAQVATEAPKEGQFQGPSPFRFWSRVAGFFAFPIVFFAVVSLRDAPQDRLMSLEIGASGGVLFAALVWLGTARVARHVRWNPDGVQVTWFHGTQKTFRWEELVTVTVTNNVVTVRTRTGEKFAVYPSQPGYRVLEKVLAAHAWAQNAHEPR